MDLPLVLDPTACPGGAWPRRWALWSVLCAVPLVLFGGSVTTLGAGMAVDGWLIAEGHFLLFFPVDKWFRDTPTFVEHTHRLFGALVGLTALLCAATAWWQSERAPLRRSALLALVAVCLQGVLGGLRVLENDAQLAFLHGALAQLVFAVLCGNALVFSAEWREAFRRNAPAERRRFARVATLALVVTYAQVVIGAWYRHGLRPTPVGAEGLRFVLHAGGAVAVLVSVAVVARHAAALQVVDPGLPRMLVRLQRVLPGLLVLQILLGGLAWAGFRPGAIGPAEWVLSVCHVFGGALLLATLAGIALWARRLAGEGQEARA